MVMSLPSLKVAVFVIALRFKMVSFRRQKKVDFNPADGWRTFIVSSFALKNTPALQSKGARSSILATL